MSALAAAGTSLLVFRFGLGVALIAGLGGAGGLLATFWRPASAPAPTAAIAGGES